MAFGSDRAANFVIKAKDAATGPMGKIGAAMGKLRSAAGTAFKAIGAAAVAAGAAVTAFAVDGIRNAAAFQTAMLNVNSIAKATPEAFKEMQDAVLEMSKRLPQSAETLAQGLYDISSSGFAGADGIKVLEAAAKAASAGLAQTSESAAGITAVLNAYGLGADQAQKVSDVLFKTVDRGVITFPELAAEIGKTTALAAPLGVSLEEVAAGIATLTKNGIDGANATTQLNAVMQQVLSPSAKAARLAGFYGVELGAQALATKGLSGFMADLIKKTKGSSEAMADILGDSRAIRGAFVLAKEGGAMFNEELALMKNAAGATDTALSYQEQGLNFQMQILSNNIDAIGISLGQNFLPGLTALTQWITKDGLPKLEEFGAGIASAAQPFLEDLQPAVDGLFASMGELFTEVGKLVVQLWDDGNGPLAIAVSGIAGLFDLFLKTLRFIVDTIKLVIQLATEALKVLDSLGGTARGMNTATVAAGESGVFGLGSNRGSTFTTNTNLYLDGKLIAESTDSYLGRTYSYGGSRTNP